jgi:Tol biopolymer transport system component
MITRRLVRIAPLASVALGMGSLLACVARPAPTPLPEPTRLAISIPADRALDAFAMSPDGRWLAYSAEGATDGRLHLFLRSVDGTEDRELDEAIDAHSPFFSPDGNWVAYFSRGGIWKSSTGRDAAPQKLCDAPTDSAGGAWTDDGRVVFAPLGGQGLMAVSDEGGTPGSLTTLNTRDGDLAHGWPHALPHGGLIFTRVQRGRDAHIEALPAPSSSNASARRVLPVLGQAQYVSTGHLVYSYLGDLLAVRFDINDLQTRGDPVVLEKGIMSSSGFDHLGSSAFSVSPNGTLAWLPSGADDLRSHLVRVDYHGMLSPLAAPAAQYQTPRISPDGRRIAVVVRSGIMTRDIQILDATRPERVVFTVQGGDNQSPAWMPDGRLSFASNRDGLQKIYVTAIGTKRGPAPLFSANASSARNPASWSRAPLLLALYEIDEFRGRDVLVYHVGEAVLPVAATPANERSPALSQDSRWIAYVSDASGRDEVYTKRLEEMSDERRISRAGGVEPVWTRDGLLYREGDRVVLADKTLFEGRFEKDPGANAAAYDVDPRGRFLLMLKSARVVHELRLVTNWGTDLVRHVPGAVN